MKFFIIPFLFGRALSIGYQPDEEYNYVGLILCKQGGTLFLRLHVWTGSVWIGSHPEDEK